MHGYEITTHVRHSRLMDEFDKLAAKEGESLDSIHERLTTLVNIMDRNYVRPISVAINTKFLNACNQNEANMAKKAAKNHDHLAPIAHSNASSSHSHANSSYSPQSYYVIWRRFGRVHASSQVHEQVTHGKRKTIIQTTDDDQIDSNIIFDDPFVENNGGTSEHDSTALDEYREIQMLAYNVQHEAEIKKRLNNELKKQKDLLQRELETFKDRVKAFE
ncbi:hypothetical protein Tco_0017150 [Tanacetum coccineum]